MIFIIKMKIEFIVKYTLNINNKNNKKLCF